MIYEVEGSCDEGQKLKLSFYGWMQQAIEYTASGSPAVQSSQPMKLCQRVH